MSNRIVLIKVPGIGDIQFCISQHGKVWVHTMCDLIRSEYRFNYDSKVLTRFNELYRAYVTWKIFQERKYNGVVTMNAIDGTSLLLSYFVHKDDAIFWEPFVLKTLKNFSIYKKGRDIMNTDTTDPEDQKGDASCQKPENSSPTTPSSQS